VRGQKLRRQKIDRLWAMEVFIRVAECGSFSRASESLNLANATVSTCVRNLEEYLGVTLISRDTRRQRLTEEGELFLPKARELLQALAFTEEEVRTHVGALRGSLHIEAPISLGHALLCPKLPVFTQRYPDISSAITLTNQPHNLIERGIDVAVRVDHVEDQDLVARPIYESKYVICCTPEAAASLPPHPSELDTALCLGMLIQESRYSNAWHLSRGDEKVAIVPKGPLHFNSSDGVLIAAASGIGLACVLDIFANAYIDSNKLVRVYEGWDLPGRTFYVVSTKDRANSAKVRAFTEFLLEVLDSTRLPHSHEPISIKALWRR
jgi:LysR family transcriptional regulator for bpeEF and oprC